MTPEERRSAILAMLAQNTSVQVAQLAEAFGTSRVTARGDLDALAALGKLRRTHGGAISLSKTLTVSTQDRRVNVNVEAKRAIARTAAGFVSDGEAVLVDSGTTALEFVRALEDHRDVTVVTNDFTIARLYRPLGTGARRAAAGRQPAQGTSLHHRSAHPAHARDAPPRQSLRHAHILRAGTRPHDQQRRDG